MAISSAVAVGLSLFLLSQSEGYLPLLSAIRLEMAVEMDWSKPVFVDAWANDAAALGRGINGDAVVDPSGKSLRFELKEYAPPSRPPTLAERQESFIVDFSEPSLTSMIEELRAAHGPTPSTEELVDFVDKVIVAKSYARGWDIASQVARDRAGDCTEHAVLLTALARASGYGARIVMGTAIIVGETSSGAFGHAWSEIYDGRQWLTSDAALAEISEPVHYIRGGVLENESPSYRLGILTLANSVAILHLTLSNERE